MAAMDFQEMIQTCRSIKTVYSRPFQGLPNTINLSRDGRQVLFLSGGPCTATLYPIMAMVRGGNVYPRYIRTYTLGYPYYIYTHWGTPLRHCTVTLEQLI